MQNYLGQPSYQDNLCQDQWAAIMFLDHKQEHHQQQHQQYDQPLSPPQEDASINPLVSSFSELMAYNPSWESTTTASPSPDMMAASLTTTTTTTTGPALVAPYYHQQQAPEFVSMAMASPSIHTIPMETHNSFPPYYMTTPNHATATSIPTGGSEFYLSYPGTVHAPPSPPLSTSPLEDLDTMMMMIKQEEGQNNQQQEQQQEQQTQQGQVQEQQEQKSEQKMKRRTTSGSSNTCTRGVQRQTRKTKHQKHNSIYQCDKCNKVFTRPYNLKSHLRTHTDERPHICTAPGCDWRFARPHDLKRHELLHSGVKPHGCPHCKKRFARRDALRRHWKVEIVCGEEAKRMNIIDAAVGRRRAKKDGSVKGQQRK